jgi:molybdenum cofactor cytidylyltransferase
VGHAAQPRSGCADPIEVEPWVAQEGLIDDEDDAEARFDFLAARFSLRLCWAFFLSVLLEPLSLFATIASSGFDVILGNPGRKAEPRPGRARLPTVSVEDRQPFVSAIVLAAGSATRFGSAKQLAEVEGRPLVQHAVDAAADGGADEVVVVLGANADAIEPVLRMATHGRVVRNPEHELGQSTSLRHGILAASPKAAAVVVVLADQPGVTAAEVRAVIAAYRDAGDPIVRAAYRGTPGHPVLIDRALFDEVLAEDGDTGARDVVARHDDEVREVAIDRDPPGDVDTPGDLEVARRDVFEPGNPG